jgi:hypothetical protein
MQAEEKVGVEARVERRLANMLVEKIFRDSRS